LVKRFHEGPPGWGLGSWLVPAKSLSIF
jgi:hypothetical protein